MKIFLGIDGGGTRTRAILVNEQGLVLSEGQAGPSNHHNVGIDAAGFALRAATEAAWFAAGLPLAPASAAFLGCAGVKASVDIARLTAAAEAAGLAPAGHVTVANDLHNALTGGLAGSPGIALIAGTGTNCLGRDATGASFMCGGWGWLLDDIGGGVGIALAGLRAATRAADGRAPQTVLLPAALAFFGLSEANELLERLYVRDCPPEEIAAFASVVTREAGSGDAAALCALREGANALAQLVAGAERALQFPDGPEVVLLGGCACSGAPYQPMVETAILDAVPGAHLVTPAGPPVHGAALNALRSGSVNPLPTLDFSRNTTRTELPQI
jgi:N-acetylglucosamine kinase-like BadF-type ATPase